jgi:hypothetical protein
LVPSPERSPEYRKTAWLLIPLHEFEPDALDDLRGQHQSRAFVVNEFDGGIIHPPRGYLLIGLSDKEVAGALWGSGSLD